MKAPTHPLVTLLESIRGARLGHNGYQVDADLMRAMDALRELAFEGEADALLDTANFVRANIPATLEYVQLPPTAHASRPRPVVPRGFGRRSRPKVRPR